jgi:hypothetical protein
MAGLTGVAVSGVPFESEPVATGRDICLFPAEKFAGVDTTPRPAIQVFMVPLCQVSNGHNNCSQRQSPL